MTGTSHSATDEDPAQGSEAAAPTRRGIVLRGVPDQVIFGKNEAIIEKMSGDTTVSRGVDALRKPSSHISMASRIRSA